MDGEIFIFDMQDVGQEVIVGSESSEKLDSVEIMLMGQHVQTDDDDDSPSSSDTDDYEVIDVSDDDSTSNSMELDNSKLSRDDFEFTTVLGMGGYGKVYLARKKAGYDQGVICAMKVLKKKNLKAKSNELEHIQAERNVLATIKHPFIVQLIYAFQNEKRLYLGLEYMCGGELFTHLRDEKIFPEDKARFYACEIILALDHLHFNGIIYRDLKPENILLDAEGHIKLADFGLCKEEMKENRKTYTLCGTYDYMAPEMLKGFGHDRSVDWWALGILLYDMLTGDLPFKSEDAQDAVRKIYTFKLAFEKTTTRDAIDLIENLLQTDVNERLGCGYDGVDEIQRHPFFRTVNWDHVLKRKIKPPFQPKITDIDDTSYFDKKFTTLIPQESPPNFYYREPIENPFKNFSYINESFLEQAVNDIDFSDDNFEQNIECPEVIEID